MERSIWISRTADLEREVGCQDLHIVPRFLLLGVWRTVVPFIGSGKAQAVKQVFT